MMMIHKKLAQQDFVEQDQIGYLATLVISLIVVVWTTILGLIQQSLTSTMANYIWMHVFLPFLSHIMHFAWEMEATQ